MAASWTMSRPEMEKMSMEQLCLNHEAYVAHKTREEEAAEKIFNHPDYVPKPKFWPSDMPRLLQVSLDTSGVLKVTMKTQELHDMRLVRKLENITPHRMLTDGLIILPLRSSVPVEAEPEEESCRFCPWHDTKPRPPKGNVALSMMRCHGCKKILLLAHFRPCPQERLAFSQKCFDCRNIAVSDDGDPLDSDLWSQIPSTDYVFNRHRELYPHLLNSVGIEEMSNQAGVWTDVELEQKASQKDRGCVWKELSKAEKQRYMEYLWIEGEFGDIGDSEYSAPATQPTHRWTTMFERKFTLNIRRRIYDRAEQLLALSKGRNMSRKIYLEHFPLPVLPDVDGELGLLVRSLIFHGRTRHLELGLSVDLRRNFGRNRVAIALFPYSGREVILNTADINTLDALSALCRRFARKKRMAYLSSDNVALTENSGIVEILEEARRELYGIMQWRYII